MQSKDRCQIDFTQLENPGCHKCQEVDYEQILGNDRYVAKHGFNLLFSDFTVITCILRRIVFVAFRAQNYEKYLFYCAKRAANLLFFTKKVIFSNFLLFF